jgi:hypothetical protein
MTDRKDLTDHDLLIRIDENVEKITNCQADQEARIRTLETWKSERVGELKVAAGTGGAAGAAGGLAGGFFAAFLAMKAYLGGA